MRNWTRTLCLLSFVFAPLLLNGCTKHEVDVKPVEIKPIHITIDVNVKVDRALDDFFSDIDEASQSKNPQ